VPRLRQGGAEEQEAGKRETRGGTLGKYTTNNLFYLPAYGARGRTELNLFEAKLEAADAFLTSLQGAAAVLQGIIVDIQGAMSTFVTLTGAQTVINKRILPRCIKVVSTPNPTPNIDTTDVYSITALAEAASFGAPTGSPEHGQRLTIIISSNGVAQNISWNSKYQGMGVLLPDLTMTDVPSWVEFLYNANTLNWELYTSSGLFG
jgi:hypothetical protein